MSSDPPALLRAMFDAAVAAADPLVQVPAFLPPRPPGRVVVVGARRRPGWPKAIEQAWDGPVDGLVVTRYGHTVQCRVRWSNRSGSPRPRRHGSASALRSTIADLLRERIIDGETKLGTKLSDHELSQEFEMYCNTLRDALRLLSRDRRVAGG